MKENIYKIRGTPYLFTRAAIIAASLKSDLLFRKHLTGVTFSPPVLTLTVPTHSATTARGCRAVGRVPIQLNGSGSAAVPPAILT